MISDDESEENEQHDAQQGRSLLDGGRDAVDRGYGLVRRGRGSMGRGYSAGVEDVDQ